MNFLDKKNQIGYPSLDILEKINMITFLSNDEIKTIHDNNCPICLHNYKKIELNDKFSHNSSILINLINNEYNKTLELNFDDDDITDRLNNVYAIKTKCCENNICINCLKTNIMYTQQVICPFCNLDFSITDKKYIEEIVPDKMNIHTWIDWWTNHC
jgi:hypothetical protein